jgi:predicted DNA-binding transcriptional regulator AlpA
MLPAVSQTAGPSAASLTLDLFQFNIQGIWVMEPTTVTAIDVVNQKQDAPLLLSAEKLAQILGISIRTLWRLRAAGKLPVPIRLGGSVRWRLADIEAWIAAGCPKISR